MEQIRIVGGNALHGKVCVGGSKNAALPILFSALLAEGKSVFKRVPRLQDIRTTVKLLEHLGVESQVNFEQNTVALCADRVNIFEAPYDLVRTMRASVVVLGPLLARFGRAKVSLQGGCAIGARPINYHLSGLEKLGAKIELENGYVIASAKKLKGNRVSFEFPSVGATENIMMAAALAEGESVLENCAKEPEIIDLARTLRSMGAEIEGEGTEEIRIQGKQNLHACDYEIMGDRIEAGTFLAAAFATRGSVTVQGVNPEYLEALLSKFEEAGAEILREKDQVTLLGGKRPVSTDMTTQPYPGFATDMQAQFMTTMAVAEGASVITETIFENRFMHVPELVRMGADITVRGHSAIVRGSESLQGAEVMATDLRASACLIIAGLCANGETVINRIYHLDRGYEGIEHKLRSLGAQIQRVNS